MHPPGLFIRSALFNIAFYGTTALVCILCLPGLLLPKRQAMWIVKLFVHSVWFFERFILGLNFEIRGRENLPAAGSFIVAAKHQSPYETMKMHILFDDPAIVLKKELLKIPLWGWFLAKSEPVAINRSRAHESLGQIGEEGLRAKAQGRPIIIFPQGTRVHTWQTAQEKPYKAGVAKLRDVTGLPVIPMALNSGVFWPRSSWIKKPGRVVFEFLAPVQENLGIYEVVKDIQARLEHHSDLLVQEAQEKQK
ncbi:MAG: 1-acyl-sn-glycerol-3-phosphate acyltransferase [Proteobacteria bacterium]|nr:1-acyl-sn-glycerol-3-phosphate acyltransferase [Pseudomonadota bacterium]